MKTVEIAELKDRLSEQELTFATHDPALATAARAVGFRVLGAPA